MIDSSFPRLSELFDTWRVQPRFFYLSKFLDGSRLAAKASQGIAPQSLNTQRKGFRALWILYERLCALAGFIALISRVLLVPKGFTVVFNHTSRVRRLGTSAQPLYLSQVFDLEKAIVFEDAIPAFKYPSKVHQFQSGYVTRASQIAGGIACYAYMRHRLADRDIATFVIARTFWILIFRVLRPSRIHLFVWYGKEAVIAAAKSLNIDVADVQHGVIYESHPFYNISNVDVGSEYLLPNKCLVYGEYWRSLLIRAGWQSSQVQVIGYFLDVAIKNDEELPKPYILYTSQPHTSGAIVNHIRSILSEVQARNFRVVIACHPSEPEGLYSGIFDESVKILRKWDSYDLLHNCTAHVSVSSTLLWEAMVFGKPSYVLEYGREAVDLLSDLLFFGYGKNLDIAEFPSSFPLPTNPPIEYFFSQTIDKSIMYSLAERT